MFYTRLKIHFKVYFIFNHDPQMKNYKTIFRKKKK